MARQRRWGTSARVAATIGCSIALVAGACSSSGDERTLDDLRLVAALEAFGGCEDLLGHLREQALEQVGPWGLGGGMYATDLVMPTMAAADGGVAARESTAGAPATTTAGAVSSDAATGGPGANAATNNQEADVDEADLVKADGDRIVSVRGRELLLTDLVGGVPVLRGRVALGEVEASRLFLLGDRAYVLGIPTDGDEGSVPVLRGAPTADIMPIGGWSPRSSITEVTLGDVPSVAGTTVVEGNVLDGRMVDGTVRLVLSSQGGTRLGFVAPAGDGGEAAQQRALEANREVVRTSTIEDWLPAVVDGDDRTPLLDCAATYRPAEFSGFSVLSVLTIADGLDSLMATGVLSDSQTTYASAERLYVTTTQWSGGGVVPMATMEDTVSSDDATSSTTAPAVLEHTDVHAFDIGGTKAAEYLASGRIDGQLLNQYSMSDRDGRLRIATTVSSGTTGGTDSRVTVLAPDGRTLVEVGSVGGLGVGETIRSVRFVDDLAYVVTFRQTDPFYVIDLSDPTAPRKLGELKVPGFSAYLHPVGEDRVLGVGSDADAEGRITGAKVSLYDVADPLAPKELAVWTSTELQFLVDGDPKAFAWDPARSQALLPFTGACWSDTCSSDAWSRNGALVLRVSADGIAEAGRLDHGDRSPGVVPPVDTTTTTVPTTEPDVTTTVPTTTPGTTTPDTTVVTTTVPTTTPETTVPAEGEARSVEGSAGSGDVGTSSPPSPGVVECGPAVDCVGPLPMPKPYLEPMPMIQRAFVVGDVIVTLSDAGIATHDVVTLARRGFAAF